MQIKFLSQEVSLLRLQAYSRTYLPSCYCPWSSWTELPFNHLAVLETIYSHPTWDIEYLQIFAPSFLRPKGLTKFYWNSFAWIPQVFEGLRYDFNKEVAWVTNPGIRTHEALRIWKSKSLSRTRSFLEVRFTLLRFSLRLPAESWNLKDSSLCDLTLELSLAMSFFVS